MAKNLYRTYTSSVNYYETSSFNTEPNMRNELIYTLDGRFPEEAKGQNGLLRIMKRDTNGKLIPCACVDLITREQDKDRWCPWCMGSGFYWDESSAIFYRVPLDTEKSRALQDRLSEAGLINVPLVIFYIRYSSGLTTDDRIILVNLDNDGSISSPLQRRAIYRIGDLWDYRADNGKLEYWKAVCFEEKVKYINAPDFADLEG